MKLRRTHIYYRTHFIDYFRSRMHFEVTTQVITDPIIFLFSWQILRTIRPPANNSQHQFATFNSWSKVRHHVVWAVDLLQSHLPVSRRDPDIRFDTITDNAQIKIIRIWPQGIPSTHLEIDYHSTRDIRLYANNKRYFWHSSPPHFYLQP
jgi:hypothetical protein